ncbi:hypothetical protein niasHT_004873 [Heterodera trifolii]|uniref:DNA-directed DNA polymerase n=1 Tax=Heterodera trifolii TaxID=157864 RepID=A0ABD2LS51_9BILA
MAATAATVAVAIRWAPSQGRRLFSSSSRSDVQQSAAEVMYSMFSGPQQWKAGHKIHKMFNGEQQNDGNDNGRVVRKPPRRSRNANGDVPESDIVRKRARQNSTSNSSGTNRGTTSSQSGGGGDDWSAFGGGGNNNNNSRRTGTTPLDLDMLLMPQMRGSTSAAAVVQQVPQGSNATSAAAVMPVPFLDNNNTNLPVTFSRGSDGSGGGGGALTVAAHMPWGLSTTGGGSGEGASVQHLQNLVYMAGVPQSGLQAPAATMTTAAAATWTANSGTFVSGGCGGAVVAGGMFGRASCGGSVGGASGFGGMQALPPHIRDAIERVHQRQMQKMITVQPDFADILPQCADNGMSSLGWLMLDWQADMVMGRVVGIVVLCGPFTTVSGLSGFDVRLMFDHDNLQQEMAVHCWEECMPRLANNIQCGAVVEFCRLKVREQGKNNKGSFPYTLLYNNESRHRILSASSNNSANQAISSSNTAIIVEAVEQQQHCAGGSTAASARPSAAGTTAIVSSGHHRNMPITLAQQNTGGGGNQDVRVAKNGNGNATDVHEQQSEDDGPNATAANLSSVGAQRVVDAEHDDDDEEGTSETAWLSTARPPPPSCTPVGRPLHRRPRRRRLLQSISPQAGPSGGHRSSPPPQRACSISAQRNLHTVVQRINDLEAQVARDERNARERRQRARRQQLLLQQHQHMPLSSSSSPSPPPRPVANAAEADVITIDDVEPLGLEPQQQLHRGDARYFAHELMTLEDEAGAAEMIILDNEPLSVADREWLISTAFKMRQLPSSVKGSVEADENGNNNISCCICHDWLVSDADSVRCSVWPQFGRGRTPRTAATTTTANGTGSGSSNAETAENNEDEDDDTAQLGRYSKVVGVWERTECRSRNTRCEAFEVALNGWAGARRPDTLLAQCITHLMDRVLAGRGRPLRIGMSCQPPKFASPYHIPHRAPEQNTAAAMAAELERLAAQSAGGVDLFGGTVLFRISAVWPLERNSGAGACAADEREARGSVRCRSFFPVVNPDDTWCLARAVVLGLADRHFQHLYGADSQQATAHLRTFWLAQHGHGGEQAARQLLQSPPCRWIGPATGWRTRSDFSTRSTRGSARSTCAWSSSSGSTAVACCGRPRIGRTSTFACCCNGMPTTGMDSRNSNFTQFFLFLNSNHSPQAKQYCVECERPVHRRSHPLGCRAVCGLCLRYDALHFPCRREADTPQGGLFCAQCRFVFQNADCFAAHRQCVDPPPALGLLGGGGGGGGAVVDRRRGRLYRSMCEERRLCAQCNVVVWARSGAHHCRRQQPLQQHVRAIATASTAAPMAPTTAAAAATVATVAAVGQQQQQQQHHCQKCGGPHDASRTPHFVQPKQFARQCQWQQHNINGIADDVQEDQDEEGEDNESDAAATAARQQGGLKHVPVLVCAEVICERAVCRGGAPTADDGAPASVNNNSTSGVDIGADELGAVGRQLPPDGLNPRRLRFFCDGEPGTGRGAMEQFVDFLLHTGPKGVRTVMLAHNGGRYDIHLLLEELQRRGERPRRAVQHGLRVYMLELRGTHQRELICKDSLNYFHCALATLPRTFGLRGVPDKPFFPYHHIHARNLDVELPAGTLPPPAAYDPDRMRAEQRERFMEWYAHELRRPGRQPFLLRRKLLRYCWNDVKILRTACLRFRELVGECADGMEPFLAATTIASLAMAVFHQHHLRPNTMVHTPEGGFLRGRRASVESRRFFTLLAAVRPDLGPLRTARWSIGEAVVGDSGRAHRRRDNNSTNSCAGADDDGFRLDCVAYRHPPLRPLCIEFNGC